MANNKQHEVSKVYVDNAGNYHNLIGPEDDPKHGHIVVTQQGDVKYARDYGESKSNPSIPDTSKQKK